MDVASCKAVLTSLGPSRRHNPKKTAALSAAVLPLLGSNQDSPDPESGVLPVTPRGSFLCHGAEGDRTPDLCSAIAALSQLSYSPVVARVPPRSRETYRLSPTDVNQTQPRSPSIGVTGSLESPSLQGPNPISPSPA